MHLSIDNKSEELLATPFQALKNSELVHCYVGPRDLVIVHSIDNGKNHISISTPNRQPSWKEIKEVKYALLPKIEMAIILPSEDEYVNLHEYCFHLYEL